MLLLQQSLWRSLRLRSPPFKSVPSSLTSIAPCAACTCRCGNALPVDNLQRRSYAARGRAPSTRKKYNKPPPKTGTRAFGDEQFNEALELCASQGYLDPDIAKCFFRDFSQAVHRSRSANDIEPKKLHEVLEHYGVDENYAVIMAHALLINRSRHLVYYGTKLILSLARAGCAEAAIIVMAHARMQHQKNRQALQSLAYQHAKATLTKIANQGQNYRAMVCEGMVALELGDEERAIEMYTGAIPAAIFAAQKQEERVGEAKYNADQLGLSSPWIDLFLLHHYRSFHKGQDEWEKCRWAMEIGCQQDDPVSHYHASTYFKKVDEHGNHVVTSKWVYYITKAALSDHPKAAYELGEFYAESGWKYLEQDEPPDHIKPTPFDSYPGPSANFWGHLRVFLGLDTARKLTPQEGIYFTAAFPATAEDRYRMAFEWLERSTRMTYVPAHLLAAKLYLEAELWGQANAPQSAIELKDERYDYATREDFERGVTIEKISSAAEPPNTPNPFRSRALAEGHLREIFFAHESFAYAEQVKVAKQQARLRGRVAGDSGDDDVQSAGQISLNIRKYFRFPEVRDMYAHEIEHLCEQAKSLCDKHELDIFDVDQSLIYRAGSKVKRSPRNYAWWGIQAHRDHTPRL